MKKILFVVFSIIILSPSYLLAKDDRFKMGWRVISQIHLNEADIYYTIVCYDSNGGFIDISENFPDKDILPLNRAITVSTVFNIPRFHKRGERASEVSICTLAIDKILVKKKGAPYELLVNYSALFVDESTHELVIPPMFDGR